MSDNLIQRTDDFLRRNMRTTIQMGGVNVVSLVRELGEEAERLQAIRVALAEYNAAMDRREHGAVAASRLIAVVIEQTAVPREDDCRCYTVDGNCPEHGPR